MAKKKTIEDLKVGLTFGNSQNVEKKEETVPAIPAAPTAPEVKPEQVSTVPAKPVAEPKVDVKPVQETPAAQTEQKEVVSGGTQSLAEIYREKFQPAAEKRTERIQIVVTPTISKKLDELVRNEKIKSKNDLINFLLEGYLADIR